MKIIAKNNKDKAIKRFNKFINEKKISDKLDSAAGVILEFWNNIGFKADFEPVELPFLSFEILSNSVNKLKSLKFYAELEYENKSSDKYKEFNSIKELFKNMYKTLTDKNSGCGYELYLDLGLRACPYCNLNYIDAIVKDVEKNTSANISSDNKILRHHFDHFYPMSVFPFFGISYYNLIPCCYECNSAIKGAESKLFGFNPYVHDFDSNAKFSLWLKSPNLLCYDEFEIKLNTSIEPYSTHIKLFELIERYKYKKEYVKELLIKNKIYTDEYINELKNILNTIPESKGMIDLILWGNYTDTININKRPLSKLTKDVLEILERPVF